MSVTPESFHLPLGLFHQEGFDHPGTNSPIPHLEAVVWVERGSWCQVPKRSRTPCLRKPGSPDVPSFLTSLDVTISFIVGEFALISNPFFLLQLSLGVTSIHARPSREDHSNLISIS